MAPETRYARRGDLHVAYQVLGTGPDEAGRAYARAAALAASDAERAFLLERLGMAQTESQSYPPAGA